MTTPSSPLHNDDETASSFAGTGQLLGTNDLQRSVQQFSEAVDRLQQIVSDAGQSNRGSGAFAVSGSGTVTPPSGFAGLLGSVPGVSSGGQAGQGTAARGSGVPSGRSQGSLPSGGFSSLLQSTGGGWYGGTGGGGGGSGIPSGGTSGGGGGGFSALLGRGGTPVLASVLGNVAGPMGALAGYGIGKAASMFSSFASNSMAPQVTMSSYLQQQLSMTNQNSGAARQQILNQAFGSNAMATGPSDAAVGQSILNAVSGFTATGAPGYAQPLAKGAANYNALFNITNGMSMTQSAGMTSQLMSPQTAMNFMMLGLGKSAPLQLGGKVNTNAAGMYESLFSRLAPGENQNQLRYNMRSGGVLSSELGQLTGLSGQNLESFITSGLDVSKLQSEGLSSTKINQLMQQAGSGNRTAQNTLNKYGVSLTDLQAQKDVTATKTSRQSDVEQSFSTGLQAASQSLVAFNNAINAFLKIPAINQLVGTSAGYKGEASKQGNLLQTLVAPQNSLGGKAIGFFSHLFGGGAASPSQKTQSSTAGSSSKNTNTSGIAPQAAVAVRSAESQLGVPYTWGVEQPGVGFDCSGLVQWAYEQAGIALPRTSQAQWAYLHGKQVPLNKVQEGDILFAAGSDGTASSPGHEALMVNQKQLVQAPYTGSNVQIDAYDPSQWLYAARPAGSLSGSTAGGSTTANTSNSNVQGNAGGVQSAESSGLGLDPGSYGSVDELQAVQGALLGGVMAGAPSAPGGGSTGSVSSSGGNTQSSSTSSSGKAVANSGSGWTILQKTAAEFGWGSGAEWTALKAIENQEDSSASPTIKNYGGSGALGMAQALGHGTSQTAGTLGNQYGGYGLTAAQAKQANSGNAAMQALWMLNYIKTKYGDPIKAEAYHLAHNSYAGGTRNADKGLAVVGERGPELITLTGGEQIFNASQSAHIARQDAKQPPSHPYASMLSGNFSLPDLPSSSPAVSAAAGGTGSGGINLNFNEGSISLGSGVTTQDAKNFASAVATAIEQNQTLQAIAAGDLHG